jgi:hypothetical protein
MAYKPERKAVSLTTSGASAHSTGGSAPGASYNRKAASPVSKATYVRKAAGVSPANQPVNDKDAK